MTREEQQAKIVDEYKISGLTKAEFCHRKNISVSTLYLWQCKYELTSNPCEIKSRNFIPVEILLENKKEDVSKIIIKTRRGCTIEIPSSIFIEKISQIFKELA